MAIHLPETDKDYYLLISEPVIYAKAKQMGISAIYYTNPEVDRQILQIAEEKGKSVILIYYDKTQENFGWFYTPQKTEGVWVLSFNAFGIELEDDTPILTPDDAAEQLQKIIDNTESYMVSHGITKQTDYEGRCGNCHSQLESDDKYCRYCGTRRGEGSFQPYTNEMYCVYGPPIRQKHKCPNCGYSWETTRVGGDKSQYCPQCGEQTLVIERIMLDFSDL